MVLGYCHEFLHDFLLDCGVLGRKYYCEIFVKIAQLKSLISTCYFAGNQLWRSYTNNKESLRELLKQTTRPEKVQKSPGTKRDKKAKTCSRNIPVHQKCQWNNQAYFIANIDKPRFCDRITPMVLLAINTATDTTEVVFLEDGKVVRQDSWPAESNESDRLLPYLQDKLDDLDALFVVRGPGSYTALRVGITIVNTLAFALKIPIYSIKTSEFQGTLAETLLQTDFSKMEKKDIVEPFYLKPPSITPPKK